MNDTPTLSPFQHWILEAATASGLSVPPHIDPLGIELEAEGHLARVTPHSNDTLAITEVDVCSLADVSEESLAQLAVQLLRINHEARFEHGWQIVLDDDDTIGITTTLSMSATDAETLAMVLVDGIERACALAEVVSGLLSPAFAQTQAPLDTHRLAPGAIVA